MPSRVAERSGPVRESPAPRAAERRRIVASKLSAPRLRPGIVDRPRLVADRIATTDVPVVLVSAPAGYGKTTLLALWRARDDRPFVWVTLEAADNDPVALIRSVVSALDPVLDLDDAVAEALAAPQPALEDFVLPTVVDACATAAGGFVLVLDNVHALTDARSLAAVGYLGERLPAGCQLALATRVEPALPLASWRAHGRLVEVRAAELSLRDAEAGAVLAAAGVRLAAVQVARLVERTEGWPAAIYLAALSLRERSRPEEFVDRFAGTSRHVADFLTEDVLARQPDEVIGFLSRTCVLEDLTASLCDALTGDDDGAAMLRELERTNLFVIPLDDDRWAYRYHHLFAEYLRADLARRDPGLVAELHRRAWRWYREHGLVGRAVAHAQACGDVKVAAELVSAAYPLMLEHGEIETLRGWISGFEDSQIEGHAPLAIAAAHIMSLVGEGERAAHFAHAAQAGSWDGAMPDGSASLESALAMLASTFASGGLSGMCRAAQRAVELEPPTSQWRPLALRNLGVALTLTGDFAAARRALDEAVGMAGGETTVGYVALAFLAMIDLREGDEEGAFQHAHPAHATAERPGWRNFMPSIYAYGVMADVLCRRGQYDEAAVAVQRATELLPRPTESLRFRLIETRIRLAPTLATLGRRDEAKTRLEEAAALLAVQPDAGVLPEWHREAVQAVRGRRSTSPDLSDAERRILRLLATDLTLRDIGRELYLSHNTVKTHTSAIYRKLGVSSRAELREAMAADREARPPKANRSRD